MSPLRFLHDPLDLNRVKLATLERLSNTELIDSLAPNQPGSLKTREDGTVLDGHHRLHILANRGVDIHGLRREIIEKDYYDA
jgi:hypothetical protein